MRKRVHLHQLRVGMYVEELEGEGTGSLKSPRPFLIRTSAQVEKIMQFNAMSAVINVAKGRDVDCKSIGEFSTIRRDYETQLLNDFSIEEIEQAKATIKNTAPNVRELLLSVHTTGTMDMASAAETVGEIMRSTLGNSGALINLTKLKDKDEGTFIHSLSVSALMITFARALGLSEDTVEVFGLGGLVHDIGKMTIPTSILNKASKLNEREFQVIMSHTVRGHYILAKIEQTPDVVLDVCKHHHEKYDGSGYPDSLYGNNIPFAARVAAICDVYDALTTVRSYKNALTQTEALQIMMNAKGHFDPELLRQFVSRLALSGRLI